MENLILQQTKNTPKIDFHTDGTLEMEGIVLSENPLKFFDPLNSWCSNLDSSELRLVVKLEYVNTSASKCIHNLISILHANNKIGKKEIVWYYDMDDDDILEFGQILEETATNITFNFHEVAFV
jgi:hypothetical protein